VKLKGWPKTLGDIIFGVLVALLLYALLGLALHTPRPIVVVASSSMEPLLHPGDVVLVRGVGEKEINVPTVYVEGVPRTPQEAGIEFVRKGVRLVGFRVEGNFIPLQRGPVIVYFNRLKGVDIIHRAVLKIKSGGRTLYITKGDNPSTNPSADQDCYVGCIYPYLVPQEDVLGVPFFVIPRIGLIKLWFLQLLPLALAAFVVYVIVRARS